MLKIDATETDLLQFNFPIYWKIVEVRRGRRRRSAAVERKRHKKKHSDTWCLTMFFCLLWRFSLLSIMTNMAIIVMKLWLLVVVVVVFIFNSGLLWLFSILFCSVLFGFVLFLIFIYLFKVFVFVIVIVSQEKPLFIFVDVYWWLLIDLT